MDRVLLDTEVSMIYYILLIPLLLIKWKNVNLAI